MEKTKFVEVKEKDLETFELKSEDAKKQLSKMISKNKETTQEYLRGYYEAVIDMSNIVRSVYNNK